MYATAVGYRLGLTGEDVEQLSLAAFLHNLGAGCASDILSEIDQPINEESRIAQFYNERSALMLAKAEHLSYLEPAIRHYRERFDGSGYPSGLAGEQIPLFARIVAVAAAYDEMTSSSIFRSALSHEEAVFRLQQNAETIFDPVIVGAFCGIEKLGKIRRIIESELSRMQLFADQLIEDASAPRLSEILRRIKTEPWLAMQVLREANALLPDQPTAQLLTAATRLGEEKMQLLLEKYGSSSYNGASKRWSEFAVRRAVTAQLLAAHTDLMNSDEAYTLGLLYDIGAALLTNLFPNEMEEMQQLEDEARFRREIEIFGIERAQVSQWILGKCGLREVFTSTISSDCRTMCLSAPTALLITAAHRLARAEDDYKVTVIDSFDTGVLAILRLSRGNLNRIYECAAAISSEIIEGGQEMYEYA
jgi:HD-like signal output (HDOD) protein